MGRLLMAHPPPSHGLTLLLLGMVCSTFPSRETELVAAWSLWATPPPTGDSRPVEEGVSPTNMMACWDICNTKPPPSHW